MKFEKGKNQEPPRGFTGEILEDQLASAHTRITNLLAGEDVPPLDAVDQSEVLHSHVFHTVTRNFCAKGKKR